MLDLLHWNLRLDVRGAAYPIEVLDLKTTVRIEACRPQALSRSHLHELALQYLWEPRDRPHEPADRVFILTVEPDSGELDESRAC